MGQCHVYWIGRYEWILIVILQPLCPLAANLHRHWWGNIPPKSNSSRHFFLMYRIEPLHASSQIIA